MQRNNKDHFLSQGIDIVDISRIDKVFKRFKDKFLKKILTQNEIKNLKKKSNFIKSLANIFAAKEAFVKALGSGLRNGIFFNIIEIDHDNYGKPLIKLNKESKKKIKDFDEKFDNFNINLSISDEKRYTVALVTIFK